MSAIPDTPKTLLDELARGEVLDEFKWQQFDTLYRPVVTFFLVQRFSILANESDDLAQDIMVRLVDVLRNNRYDAGRARFRTYLRTLVANTAIDRIRRLQRFAEIPLDTLDWSGTATSENDLRFLDQQWAESCYQAARQHVLRKTPLAESHREIYLALERGESAKDLAMRFNVSPAAIRQIRHRIEQAINAYARTLSDA